MVRIVVVALGLATLAQAGETYEHPGGLYSLPLPDGCVATPRIDARGRPSVRFALGGGPGGFEVWALALPPGLRPQPDRFLKQALHLVTEGQPGLKSKPTEVSFKLFGRPLAGAALAGTRDGRPWKGVVAVACRDEIAYVFLAGAAPAKADAILTRAGAAVERLKVPHAGPRRGAPGREAEPADVVEYFMRSTPLVYALGRAGAEWVTLGTGSGFVVGEDGLAITNRHVVDRLVNEDGKVLREAFDPLQVSFDHTMTKEKFPAEVVAVSSRYDLALIRIQSKRPFPIFPLAHSAQIQGGNSILVMGWPSPQRFGFTAISANEGTLAAVLRDLFGRPSEYRLGGARTAQGNSGGPVFDLKVGGALGAIYEVRYHDHHGGPAQGGFREALYQAAVPARWILWDFPQVTAMHGDRELAPAARRARIASFVAQGRDAAAMLACRRLLREDARDGYAHAYLFRIYNRFGDRGRAREHLLTALRDKETRFLTTMFAGEAALDAGDLKDARGWVDRATDTDSLRPAVALLRGRVAYAAGNYGAAREAFKHAGRLAAAGHLHADVAAAKSMRAACTVQEQLARWNGKPIALSLATATEELLLESIEARPYGSGLAHAHLALLHLMSGAPQDRMMNSWKRALACDPHDPMAVFAGKDRTIAEYGTRDHDTLLTAAELLIRRRDARETAANLILRARTVRPSGRASLTAARYWILCIAESARKAGDKDSMSKAYQLGVLALKEAVRVDSQTIWGRRAAAMLQQVKGR